jgi:hypothetical protein
MGSPLLPALREHLMHPRAVLNDEKTEKHEEALELQAAVVPEEIGFSEMLVLGNVSPERRSCEPINEDSIDNWTDRP